MANHKTLFFLDTVYNANKPQNSGHQKVLGTKEDLMQGISGEERRVEDLIVIIDVEDPGKVWNHLDQLKSQGKTRGVVLSFYMSKDPHRRKEDAGEQLDSYFSLEANTNVFCQSLATLVEPGFLIVLCDIDEHLDELTQAAKNWGLPVYQFTRGATASLLNYLVSMPIAS